MPQFLRSIAPAALAIASFQAPLSAQDETAAVAAEPVKASAHQRLLDTLITDELADSATKSAVGAMYRIVKEQNPEFAQAAASNPGLEGEVMKRFYPAFNEQVVQNLELGEADKLAVLEEGLTEDEANKLADFYSTPLGQSLILGVARAQDYSKTVNANNLGEDITVENVEADARRSAFRSVRGREFTLEEQRKLLEFVSDPAFQKMRGLSSKMTAITVEIENRPPPEGLQVELAKIWLSIFDDFNIGR